jgi:hypothetical protein
MIKFIFYQNIVPTVYLDFKESEDTMGLFESDQKKSSSRFIMEKIGTHTLAFVLGMLLGVCIMKYAPSQQPVKPEAAEITQVIQEATKIAANSGKKITITRTTAEGKKEEHSTASSSTGQSQNNFLRWLGTDRGANDAASGVQALTADGVSVGGSRNWGILERTWNWFTNWIWTIKWILILVGVALVAMLFYPPTSAMALAAFQWIFSVLPLIGAAFVKIISNFSLKKTTQTTQQIIDGTDILKNNVKSEQFIQSGDLVTSTGEDVVTKANSLTARIRERILTMIKDAHNEAQDKATRAYVSAYQNGG